MARPDEPRLTGARLVLRLACADDAERIAGLVNDARIARMLTHLPHPYRLEHAQTFLREMQAGYERGEEYTFAVCRDEALIGLMALHVAPRDFNAELGYWLGVPYWGQGYATEAARAVLRFGFTALKLERIYAGHFHVNPASGRVMQRVGMAYEGTLWRHHFNFGEWMDRVCYGILREEWERGGSQPGA